MCQTSNITSIQVPAAEGPSKAMPEIGSLNDPVGELANLLAKEVFTVEPDMETMQNYGQQLFMAGFRTKEMLIENVTVDNVSEWRWMRMYHKDLFEQWIENKV